MVQVVRGSTDRNNDSHRFALELPPDSKSVIFPHMIDLGV